MDKYTATELAFKNGYEKGYEAGKKEAEDEILILKQKRANIFEILDSYERGRASALKWIPVTERLPADGSDILAYTYDECESRIFPANYANGWWHDCLFNIRIIAVTHWMPLPEPPKESNNDL